MTDQQEHQEVEQVSAEPLVIAKVRSELAAHRLGVKKGTRIQVLQPVLAFDSEL